MTQSPHDFITVNIKVLNWKKWQKLTEAEPKWFSFDVWFYEDSLIEGLQLIDPRATHAFIRILGECARKKTGEVQFQGLALRFILKRACGIRSNNFSVEKYLELLESHGLISFDIYRNGIKINSTANENNNSRPAQPPPNMAPTQPQLLPNHVPTSSQLPPNSIPTTPVGMPETHAPTELLQTYTVQYSTDHDPPLPPQGGEGVGLERFEDFWAVYPRKQKKLRAQAQWKRQALGPLADKILSAVERYRRSDEWYRENGRYIPSPAKFLRNRCWEDEIPVGKIAPFRPPLWRRILDAKRVQAVPFGLEWLVSDLVMKTPAESGCPQYRFVHLPSGKDLPDTSLRILEA